MHIAIIIFKPAILTFYNSPILLRCGIPFVYSKLHIIYVLDYASETGEIVAEPPVEPSVPVVLAGLMESV